MASTPYRPDPTEDIITSWEQMYLADPQTLPDRPAYGPNWPDIVARSQPHISIRRVFRSRPFTAVDISPRSEAGA